MIFKLLALCSVMCSVSAAALPISTKTGIEETDVAATAMSSTLLVNEVSKIIFRHRPGKALQKAKIEFQEQYPEEIVMTSNIGFYDRGYDMSVRDPLFVEFLKWVANLVDKTSGRDVRVCDFGCGLGRTSILMGLLGDQTQIHVTGIENKMTQSEFEITQKFYNYAKRLAQTLRPESDLSVFFKLGISATEMPGYEEYAPSNEFDALFMGNFLHMFDPFTAKKILTEHAHRMLRSDGVVYASVDGIVSQEGCREAYLQAKREGKEFPSVFNVTNYGVTLGRAMHIIKGMPPKYSSAIVDKTGRMSDPCRTAIPIQIYYGDKPLALYALKKPLCFYDSALIEFVFSPDLWETVLIKISATRVNDSHCADENVLKWNILAFKK